MSAPQIPHLSTSLRSARQRRANVDDEKSKEQIICCTDKDAATSRLSAVDAGYLDDPFAKLLTTAVVQRRLPLMNRGTYVRTTAIDKVVDAFLASQPGRKQIISLGAGSDTRYFRLKRKYPDLDLIYHELDFEANTKTKIQQLKSAEFSDAARQLCSIDTQYFHISDATLISSDYNLCPHDLRKLPKTLAAIKTDLPTLLLSECCLIYLSPEEADAVLTYFNDILSTVPFAVAIYEPIRPNDPFGKTMVRNLIARGIHLQTFEKYAELEHQRSRLQDYQLESRAEDTDFVWRTWISKAEKERLEHLEWMDEIEEFVLLAKHYCVSWGWRGWTDESKWSELPASGLENK